MANTLVEVPVDRDGTSKFIYTITGAITATNSRVEQITMPAIKGTIKEIQFQSTSDNCDVWISGKTALAATHHLTYLWLQNINLGYSPELARPRYAHNEDTTKVAKLYATISNNTGATTTGATFYLTITFKAY